MAQFSVSVVVKGDIDKILTLAQRAREIPRLLPDIKEVRILNNEDGKRISYWMAEISGIKFEWKQEDIIDKDNRNFGFKMIEGDFRKYEGKWNFEELNGKIKITLSMDVELGIPLIGAFLNSYIFKRLKGNVEKLLEIIKQEVEKDEG